MYCVQPVYISPFFVYVVLSDLFVLDSLVVISLLFILFFLMMVSFKVEI